MCVYKSIEEFDEAIVLIMSGHELIHIKMGVQSICAEGKVKHCHNHSFCSPRTDIS